MEIQPRQPTSKGPAEMFTGDVWYDVIARGDQPSRLRLNIVRFTPGAHTAWHGKGQDGPETEWGEHVTDEEYGRN